MGRGVFYGSYIYVFADSFPLSLAQRAHDCIRTNGGTLVTNPTQGSLTHVVVHVSSKEPYGKNVSIPVANLSLPVQRSQWTLDHMISAFALENGSARRDHRGQFRDVVVVQEQWIFDSVNAGHILDSRDNYGGWRIRGILERDPRKRRQSQLSSTSPPRPTWSTNPRSDRGPGGNHNAKRSCAQSDRHYSPPRSRPRTEEQHGGNSRASGTAASSIATGDQTEPPPVTLRQRLNRELFTNSPTEIGPPMNTGAGPNPATTTTGTLTVASTATATQPSSLIGGSSGATAKNRWVRVASTNKTELPNPKPVVQHLVPSTTPRPPVQPAAHSSGEQRSESPRPSLTQALALDTMAASTNIPDQNGDNSTAQAAEACPTMAPGMSQLLQAVEEASKASRGQPVRLAEGNTLRSESMSSLSSAPASSPLAGSVGMHTKLPLPCDESRPACHAVLSSTATAATGQVPSSNGTSSRMLNLPSTLATPPVAHLALSPSQTSAGSASAASATASPSRAWSPAESRNPTGVLARHQPLPLDFFVEDNDDGEGQGVKDLITGQGGGVLAPAETARFVVLLLEKGQAPTTQWQRDMVAKKEAHPCSLVISMQWVIESVVVKRKLLDPIPFLVPKRGAPASAPSAIVCSTSDSSIDLALGRKRSRVAPVGPLIVDIESESEEEEGGANVVIPDPTGRELHNVTLLISSFKKWDGVGGKYAHLQQCGVPNARDLYTRNRKYIDARVPGLAARCRPGRQGRKK